MNGAGVPSVIFRPSVLQPVLEGNPAVQACHAYASEGGRIIVVMTQRDKIGMEALFRRVLPPHKRLGSQFVFRQASAANIPLTILITS